MFCNTLSAGSTAPVNVLTATPISSNCLIDSGLCILVKIVLSPLPITAPPRAVVCCNEVMIPTKLSSSTPASIATAPARSRPLIKSSELTANFTSTAASLSIISVVVRPASPKALTAAVNPETASAASRLVIRVKVKASLVLFKTSATLKPWRENSRAASAATLKD